VHNGAVLCSSASYVAPLIGLIPLGVGLASVADRKAWPGDGLHRWSEAAKVAGLVLVGLWFTVSGLVTMANDSCGLPSGLAWLVDLMRVGLGAGSLGQLLLFVIALGLSVELVIAGVVLAFNWRQSAERGAHGLAQSGWWRMVSIGNRTPSRGGVRRMGGVMGLLGLLLLAASVSSLLRLLRL